MGDKSKIWQVTWSLRVLAESHSGRQSNKYIKTKEIHGGYLVVYILLGTRA
jgi:hypothetical protein